MWSRLSAFKNGHLHNLRTTKPLNPNRLLKIGRNKNLKTSFQNKNWENFWNCCASKKLLELSNYLLGKNQQRKMNSLKNRMRFSAIPETEEKTSESPARPTRMSETPRTNGKTRRRSLDRRTPMRKSLNFREGAEYLSAEERKRRNKLLQDRMYLMKYESELTKVTFQLFIW